MAGGLSEALFTHPNDDCPAPEHWHAVDAYATEDEVTELVAAMVRALQPEFVIETGSWVGTTTQAIGKALDRNGHGELVAVEIDRDKSLIARGRCASLPVTVLNVSSLDYVPTKPVDFVWFDSDPATRPRELELYLPWMHHRTVVGFHDTGPQHRVREFLSPFEASGVLQPLYLPTPRGVCFSRINGGTF
jgi:predicted O-methyltransferase YrrM